jgi:hypothetical protein
MSMENTVEVTPSAANMNCHVTLNGIRFPTFEAPIMDLNVMRAICECITTGKVRDLQTGDLSLNAHPLVPEGKSEATPTLTFGPITLPLDTEYARTTAIELLSNLRNGNLKTMGANNCHYKKSEILPNIEHDIVRKGDMIRIIRSVKSGSQHIESHWVELPHKHLADFMGNMCGLNIEYCSWGDAGDEENNYGCGAEGGVHWMTVPTGRQGQFALNVHDDDYSYFDSMIINAEELPSLFHAYYRELGSMPNITKYSLDSIEKHCRYDWKAEDEEEAEEEANVKGTNKTGDTPKSLPATTDTDAATCALAVKIAQILQEVKREAKP